METDIRPWGKYTVLLDEPNFKVKIIEMKPGHRLSLQRHQKRSEHWIVVEGIANVTLDDKTFKVSKNEKTYIEKGQKHRIANPGTEIMKFVEVQCGEYFGEDDIERFEDDYNRA